MNWVVLADPEGNEFCILRALNDDERTAWTAGYEAFQPSMSTTP